MDSASGSGSSNHLALRCAVSLAFISPHGHTAGRNVGDDSTNVDENILYLKFSVICGFFVFVLRNLRFVLWKQISARKRKAG